MDWLQYNVRGAMMRRFSRLTQNQRVLTYLIVAVVLTALARSPIEAAPAKTKVRWMIGLGTGTTQEQIDIEKRAVAGFNASHRNIELEVEILRNYQTTWDGFTTSVAAGNPPDIIGPVDFTALGMARDVTPLLDLGYLTRFNHYDFSSVESALRRLYDLPDGGLISLPFAVYPAAMFYNKDLFDEIGLSYPPAHFGEKYRMPDGSLVDWNYDTLAKISLMLTVDARGNAATVPHFDSTQIVQYGLNFQWQPIRAILTEIQPEAFYNPSNRKISIGNAWRSATKWLHDGLWKGHFIASSHAETSTGFEPSAFASGHVAMSIVPIWYTCCLVDNARRFNWNIGVVPMSSDGQYHTLVDADSFAILRSSKHPQEAFTVLSYLVNDAVPELAPAYGAFPARLDNQENWFDSKNTIFSQKLNWSVVTNSLKYANPGTLHQESYVPHIRKIRERWATFNMLLFGEQGATIDVSVELDRLQKDLQSIVNGTDAASIPGSKPRPVPVYIKP